MGQIPRSIERIYSSKSNVKNSDAA